MTKQPRAFRPEIGARVRKLRQERRWSQVRLAALLGISQNYLSVLERGRCSFTAEQLLAILKHFNVPIDYFYPHKPSADFGSQIQNALAREGAGHLAESENILPSDRLKNAAAAIREALVSADSARQIAAIAPVLVNHAGQINLSRLRNEFAELGLENRFGWAIECILAAIKLESSQVLPREWRIKYRRAATIIEAYAAHFIVRIPGRAQDTIAQSQPLDVLDPEISSPQWLKETTDNLSHIARKWRIATKIEVDDFVRALRGARDAD
jgi:transcriptional regulator with XRE-family HTH domain